MIEERYQSYQESPVTWLKRIPSHWEIRKLKFLATIQNGQDYKNVEAEFGESSYPVYGSGGAFTKASRFLYDGESVLFGRKGTIDKPLHVHEKFWTVDTMFYSHLYADTNGRYFYYQATTIQYSLIATQTALPSITQFDLSNYFLCFPPLSEQTQIARFLDHKTAQLDQLIVKKQALIERLNEQRIALITQAVTRGLNPDVPLKDSGVEWLGQVPEGWEVAKLRRCVSTVTSGSRGWAKYFSDSGDIFLRITNLTRNSIQLMRTDIQRVMPPEGSEGERTKTQPGDVLISITADLGSVAVIPDSFEAAYVSQHICLVRPERDKVLPEWLAMSVFSHSGRAQLGSSGYGGTKQQLSLADVKELVFTMPPTLKEQGDILEYVQVETEKTDRLVSLTVDTINRLEEYRTALITAAVTGKIDVRDIQIPATSDDSPNPHDWASSQA